MAYKGTHENIIKLLKYLQQFEENSDSIRYEITMHFDNSGQDAVLVSKNTLAKVDGNINSFVPEDCFFG